MTPIEALRTADTILLVDWPTREVPDSLARAGFTVVASEGPGPDDYIAYTLDGEGGVVGSHVGRPPERAQIVYVHRPPHELPVVVDLAKQVGARMVWCQTGSAAARQIVESSGLLYADSPSIVDAVRADEER